MPTCYECGDQLAPTACLTCSDCGEGFCRDHYHGHTCEAVSEAEFEENDATISSGGRDIDNPISVLGYSLAAILVAIGLIYFSREAYVIVTGEGGIEALQAMAHLILAGALFSLATFVMVASYIAGR